MPANQPAGRRGTPTPAAVIFDIGNVLIAHDPHPAIAKAVGDGAATAFLADFDFTAWTWAQDSGMPTRDAVAAASATHPQWARALAGYAANFADSLTGPITEVVEVLTELAAASVPVYGLSNFAAETFPAARARFTFLGLLADIVVSGDEGVAKPDPAIFAILEARTGIPLSRCVFIDDNATNIKVAAGLGMDAILFTKGGHLRDDLRARGLPLGP